MKISAAEKQFGLCSSLSTICITWARISKCEGLLKVLQVILVSVSAQPDLGRNTVLLTLLFLWESTGK